MTRRGRGLGLGLGLALLAAACGEGKRDGGGEATPPAEREAEVVEPASLELGERIYRQKGCDACHTIDGSPKIGPSLRAVVSRALGGQTRFSDGTFAKDEIGPGKLYPTVRDYIIASTLRPDERVVAGYPPAAPSYDGVLAQHEFEAVAMFIESLEAERP